MELCEGTMEHYMCTKDHCVDIMEQREGTNGLV